MIGNEKSGIREMSKKNIKKKIGELNHVDLFLGCMQRIADATEKWAESTPKFIELYEKIELLENQLDTERRSNASLRGHLNKLKTNNHDRKILDNDR